MRLFFQFKRIICQVPKAIKTKIKNMIKTENKNLCLKVQISFPKYRSQQIRIAKLRQQSASTMLPPQNQSDDLC